MTKQTDVRVFYLRDECNHPVACIASRREPQATRIAISQCSEKDHFLRIKARLIAVGRLESEKKTFHVPHADGKSIKIEILSALLAIPAPIELQPRTLQAIRSLWTNKVNTVTLQTLGFTELVKKEESNATNSD
jgi:hypothetical protein